MGGLSGSAFQSCVASGARLSSPTHRHPLPTNWAADYVRKLSTLTGLACTGATFKPELLHKQQDLARRDTRTPAQCQPLHALGAAHRHAHSGRNTADGSLKSSRARVTLPPATRSSTLSRVQDPGMRNHTFGRTSASYWVQGSHPTIPVSPTHTLLASALAGRQPGNHTLTSAGDSRGSIEG